MDIGRWPRWAPQLSLRSAFIRECGSALEAALLDHESKTFSEPVKLDYENVGFGAAPIAWNGEGWTMTWTQRIGADRHAFVQRLTPELSPLSSRAAIGELTRGS